MAKNPAKVILLNNKHTSLLVKLWEEEGKNDIMSEIVIQCPGQLLATHVMIIHSRFL